MKDTLYIGSEPWAEESAPLGTDLARQNCNRFIEQIRKYYGTEPTGARLFVKTNPHDFGSYLSVECEFDEKEPDSVRYAFDIEGDEMNALENWDSE